MELNYACKSFISVSLGLLNFCVDTPFIHGGDQSAP